VPWNGGSIFVSQSKPQFDFDEWADLARSDGDAFEARRLAEVAAAIERCSPRQRQRLRTLQWRIEAERRRTRTPLQACLRLSSMMWDSLLSGQEHLGQLLQQVSPAGSPPRPSAKVIPFPKRT
jgi:hypothetical protein